MTGKLPSAIAEAGTEAESQFYIPAAVSLQERKLRALKHGDTFALFDHYGDIIPHSGTPEGLFHRDTRYVSRLELLLNGHRPMLLSSTIQDDNATLAVDLTNPDIYLAGHLSLPRNTIHLQRLKFIWHGACHERIAIRNFDNVPHEVLLALHFDGDFADLFEVRGQERARRGERRRELAGDGKVAIRYRGIDGVSNTLTIRLTPAPAQLREAGANYRLLLEPQAQKTVFLVLACEEPAPAAKVAPADYFLSMIASRRALGKSVRRAASVDSSNTLFNEMITRAMSDLYMLVTETEHGPYPYAGIPWFSTPFGRDGLITALFTLWLDPTIAKGALKYLAATQATSLDADRDAEPGKILHETRGGEMARLREVPFERYYGSVDATPLFVVLAGAYLERTGDLETVRSIWPNLEAALQWIDRFGDGDGDGFVEYNRHSENGLVNQGWKDSHDSIFHADGRLAQGPIALCEVQAYVYLAKRHAARIARRLDLPGQSAELEQQADALQSKFEAMFWCEEIGTYALALDGMKQPCRVRASNAGHALFAGIASAERGARVADTLLQRDFFGGWGIRTVAASQPRYNPMSYHNGSIWPHDNAMIAMGLAHYGRKDEAARLLTAMFDAASYMDLRRLPELYCGFARRRGKGPTFYPVACSPQAWATAAPFAMLQAILGLSFDNRSREIRLKQPRLPDFLDELRLRGLRVAGQSADIEIRRHDGDVAVNVLRRDDNVRVVVSH
jgi:glycogen debranching enzyme